MTWHNNWQKLLITIIGLLRESHYSLQGLSGTVTRWFDGFALNAL